DFRVFSVNFSQNCKNQKINGETMNHGFPQACGNETHNFPHQQHPLRSMYNCSCRFPMFMERKHLSVTPHIKFEIFTVVGKFGELAGGGGVANDEPKKKKNFQDEQS